MRCAVIILLLTYGFADAQADSGHCMKIHFLYGSRPKRAFKKTEMNYFGGLHGGHVSIEVDSVDVGFVPSGKVHIFPRKRKKACAFVQSRTHGKPVYPSGMKTVVFTIPLTETQYQKISGIHAAYLDSAPYDYAFFGMRCASATYEILSQLDLVEKYSLRKASRKIFYPKLLRKRIFELADKNGYGIVKQEGRPGRKWEKD